MVTGSAASAVSPAWGSAGPSTEVEVILEKPLVGRAAEGVLDLRPVLDRLRHRTAADAAERRLQRHGLDAQEALDVAEPLAPDELLVGDPEDRLSGRDL